MSIAFIMAGVAGTDDKSNDDADVLGAVEDHVLVYVPHQISPGDSASYFLHSTPAAGFHIYDVHRLTDAERAAREDCIAQLVEPTFDDA
ncbi:MAG: hypothetical protein AB7P03_18970 [Kofleriaceae bacterium]